MAFADVWTFTGPSKGFAFVILRPIDRAAHVKESTMRKAVHTCLVVAAMAAATAASAAPVSYDFTVTAASGPLAGTSASGYFTFDSSVIPSGGGGAIGSGALFTDLAFAWNGVSYDESDANTFEYNGYLTFDGNGALVAWNFGTRCSLGGVCVTIFEDSWYVVGGRFTYGDPRIPNIYSGSAVITPRTNPVPEPGALSLAGLALAAGVAARRPARRNTRHAA